MRNEIDDIVGLMNQFSMTNVIDDGAHGKKERNAYRKFKALKSNPIPVFGRSDLGHIAAYSRYLNLRAHEFP
jgi:hypothetical protein